MIDLIRLVVFVITVLSIAVSATFYVLDTLPWCALYSCLC